LCGIGEASEVESNITNNTWDWTCGNGSCESVNCSATQRPPSCLISAHPPSVCPDAKSVIGIDSSFPPDGTLEWSSTDVDGSASGNNQTYTMGAGTATLAVTKGGQVGTCNAPVNPKFAGCTVSLSGASDLTVGDTVTVTTTPTCIGLPADSYSLDVLFNGSPDSDSHTKTIMSLNGDVVQIEINKAGSFTFDATVIGNSAGQTVSCSSQASAFTEGSEWWERKPE
ncbi:MAG: hypothetical protein U9Q72_00255, partial [Patescibacteria group bacterium]|nr:hypothetical protein [Patescibacteria group bacterium]